MSATDTPLWTPTVRRIAPDDLITMATPARVAGHGATYHELADSVLDAYEPGGWDQQSAVYGVLPARMGPPLAAETSDTEQLVAVRIPDPDVPDVYSPYHLLACLDLTAWHGALLVSEGWERGPAGRGRELRQVSYASVAGEEGAVTRFRRGRGTTPSDVTFPPFRCYPRFSSCRRRSPH